MDVMSAREYSGLKAIHIHKKRSALYAGNRIPGYWKNTHRRYLMKLFKWIWLKYNARRIRKAQREIDRLRTEMWG